jgi:2TM domain
MTPEELEQPVSDRDQALRRLKKRRDLTAHFVSYLVVNAALWGIWAVTGAGYVWPAWVAGAWGIGLLLNAWDVYFRAPITEADVEREMRRLHPQR